MDLPWDQLQDLAISDPGQKALVIFAIWVMVKKVTKEHISRMETLVGTVVDSIDKLNKSQIKLETMHSNRISALEEYFETLNKELVQLKLSMGGKNGESLRS